jgi:hypothetical protein
LHDCKKSIAEGILLHQRLALLISSSIAAYLDTFCTDEKT